MAWTHRRRGWRYRPCSRISHSRSSAKRLLPALRSCNRTPRCDADPGSLQMVTRDKRTRAQHMPAKILAIDQGTTSTRAILFDERLDIIAIEQQQIPQYYPHPGWVE